MAAFRSTAVAVVVVAVLVTAVDSVGRNGFVVVASFGMLRLLVLDRPFVDLLRSDSLSSCLMTTSLRSFSTSL